jgi:hypothetical protein
VYWFGQEEIYQYGTTSYIYHELFTCISDVCCKSRSQIIYWWYDDASLKNASKQEKNFEAFIDESPKENPLRFLVTGSVCNVRVETIEDPPMREIRYLDKLIDELTKGRPMENILHSENPA